MITVTFRRRRSPQCLNDRRFWGAFLILMLVMFGGPLLVSVFGLPAWVKPAILWGFPWAWLVVMAFIPIMGDDGVRHRSIVFGRSRTDR
jgi:hypothetical protein